MYKKFGKYSDEQLLQTRFCDLGLSLNSYHIQQGLRKLKLELAERGLKIPMYFWLSTEWFSIDNGIAIPFYLHHPRLIELELNQMGYAEGHEFDYLMKLLRHETGHVFDYLYIGDHLLKTITFGIQPKEYPTSYTYNPYSKRYVKNLNEYYAQACPDEDFAETFAVWLDPKSNWRKKYKTNETITKLCYMAMAVPCHYTIGRKIKIKKNKVKPFDCINMDMTLWDYYRIKKDHYTYYGNKKNFVII